MKNTLITSIIAGAAAFSASAATVSEVASPITENTTFVGEQVFEGQLAIDGALLKIGETDGSQTGILTVRDTSSPLANTGRIQVNKGSTLYVYTGNTPNYGTASKGQRIDIYGTVVTAYGLDSTTLPDDSNSYNLEVNGSAKSLNVFEGGVLNFRNGAMRILNGATANLCAGSKTTVGKVVLSNNNAKLVLGGNDVLTTSSGGRTSLTLSSQAKGILDVTATTNAKLNVIQFQGRSSLTINLSSAHGTLSLNKIDIHEVGKYTFDGTESLTLYDFVNDTLKIENADNLEIIGDIIRVTKVGNASKVKDIKLIAYDKSGAQLLGENEHWEFQNGYLNIVANVPEPAEWAAIFGAIALALAVYRRRR